MSQWVRAGLVLALIVAVGACGEEEDGGSAGSPTSSTTSSVPAGERGPTTTTDLAACQVEGRTIATAAEAHRAATGAYPTSIEELAGEWLRAMPTFDWQYEPAGEAFTLTGPCEWDSRTTTTLSGVGS